MLTNRLCHDFAHFCMQQAQKRRFSGTPEGPSVPTSIPMVQREVEIIKKDVTQMFLIGQYWPAGKLGWVGFSISLYDRVSCFC